MGLVGRTRHVRRPEDGLHQPGPEVGRRRQGVARQDRQELSGLHRAARMPRRRAPRSTSPRSRCSSTSPPNGPRRCSRWCPRNSRSTKASTSSPTASTSSSRTPGWARLHLPRSRAARPSPSGEERAPAASLHVQERPPSPPLASKDATSTRGDLPHGHHRRSAPHDGAEVPRPSGAPCPICSACRRCWSAWRCWSPLSPPSTIRCCATG